jgi:quercetin dioxygenase-like cupin family protein
VLSGEALLIVEGEDRPLQRWDFVHCPPETNHVIVGAGPCAVAGRAKGPVVAEPER